MGRSLGLPLAVVLLAVKRQNRRRVQQVVGPDFDDEGAAELVGDLGGRVEAGAAVEAFGEGVIDGEADIGGGVGLGLLHDPEIAASCRRYNGNSSGYVPVCFLPKIDALLGTATMGLGKE